MNTRRARAEDCAEAPQSFRSRHSCAALRTIADRQRSGADGENYDVYVRNRSAVLSGGAPNSLPALSTQSTLSTMSASIARCFRSRQAASL
jgi:hypothetical protein